MRYCRMTWHFQHHHQHLFANALTKLQSSVSNSRRAGQDSSFKREWILILYAYGAQSKHIGIFAVGSICN
ncbi:hypothetical protein BX600DRAFT_157803 [Xylariales sp. PMI_506]|nr:hypothetical protein BX600DRAFT_157803 [Xylariales sp. PMI_506]